MNLHDLWNITGSPACALNSGKRRATPDLRCTLELQDHGARRRVVSCWQCSEHGSKAPVTMDPNVSCSAVLVLTYCSFTKTLSESDNSGPSGFEQGFSIEFAETSGAVAKNRRRSRTWALHSAKLTLQLPRACTFAKRELRMLLLG